MENSIGFNDETIIGWASHDLDVLKVDEADFQRTNGMISTYVDFADSSAFPTSYAQAAVERQAALLIAWEPHDMNVPSANQAQFKPKAIANGAYDSYLKSWLTEAQQHTHNGTILIRFAPEMNDAIRSWSVGTNGGNTAEDFISMWRHVYNLKREYAPDVYMMWNPLVYGATPEGNPVDLASVYPGSDYVDLVGLDGYNWADVQNPEIQCGWQSYADVFSAAVAKIKQIAPGKPWGIAEVGSVAKPEAFFRANGECFNDWGSWVYQWPESGLHYQRSEDWITQYGWMKSMMRNAHDDGALFVNMFNIVKETDWRLNSTDEGKASLVEVAQDPKFITGHENAANLIEAALTQ